MYLSVDSLSQPPGLPSCHASAVGQGKASTVLCRSVVQWKGYIGSDSQVLNLVILPDTKAVSLYSDIARYHFPTHPRQLTCKA